MEYSNQSANQIILMKSIRYLIILLITAATMLSCGKSGQTPLLKDIIGTWKLSEVLIDSGNGNSKWNDVIDGYEYTFNPDSTFQSSRFPDCPLGSYFLRADELTLEFDCDSLLIGNRKVDAVLVESITYDSNDLLINPTYTSCLEDCSWKFSRVE